MDANGWQVPNSTCSTHGQTGDDNIVDLTCVLNVIMPKSHRCDRASLNSNHHANDLDTPPNDNPHPPRHHVAPM